MRPQQLYRSLLQAALLSLSAVAAPAAVFEPYLVLQRGVELYDGPHRTPHRLYPGDVLSARPDEQYRGWLTVLMGQNAYQTKAEGLSRLSDLEVMYARRMADLSGRIDDLTRRIAALEDRIAQLYAAEYAIRFDAALQYRIREVVLLPPSAPSRDGGRAAPLPPPVQYTERYEDKIPVSRARRLAERWARERKDIEGDAEALREERRNCVRERHGADVQRAFVTWRFAAFRADGITAAREPYVCVRQRTQLYAGTVLAQELDADTVVVAAVSRDDDQWLKVLWNGQSFDARRDGFLSRLDLETQMGLRAAWLEQAIRDKTDDVDALTARRQVLEAVSLAADYAASLEYVVLRAYPFAPDYRGRQLYPFSTCPADAVEVLNQARARGLVRDCDRELDRLAARLTELEKALRTWRRELAALGPRLAELRQRMDAAR